MEYISLEEELKEVKKQLKKAEREIRRLENENTLLINMNKKATSMRDFSERELVLAKNQAEKADRAKSDFLASMSHEIRTPINAILGMNELIIRESSEQNVRDYAKDIESSGRMLLSIINDILDFSKVESGKMEIISVEYDLASVINDIINMLSTRAKDKGLAFLVEVDKTIPSILYGDEIRIRQIIMNLMTNAIKYTEKGSVKLSLKGAKDEIGYKLYLFVSDTGKGIKEEDQKRLFESFTRVDEVENRAIEGTGLGLTLTKCFVEMMGGELSVESVYGEGSTFTAYIRQEIVKDDPIGDFEERIARKREQRENNSQRLHAPGCKVLVVDDVQMNCKVFCGLLKETGLEIDTAFSGREALNRCQNKKYNIIYMDHRMTNMDGIECLHELRSMDTPNNDTPVIILTANAISGMREMYMEEGYDDYLSKPIEVKYLEDSIRKYASDWLVETVKDNKTESVIEENKAESPQISLQEKYPELNVNLGLMYCMNDEDFYQEMIKEYAGGDKSNILKECLASGNYSDFGTFVHAVKSTSLNIGAGHLSEKAKRLENAAKELDIQYIHSNFDEFLLEYESLIKKINSTE
ncbi:MAG: ATP-binding protein [Firmicutes bacterium]|nr:ATP-binding protein [Bacillota bacterium]